VLENARIRSLERGHSRLGGPVLLLGKTLRQGRGSLPSVVSSGPTIPAFSGSMIVFRKSSRKSAPVFRASFSEKFSGSKQTKLGGGGSTGVKFQHSENSHFTRKTEPREVSLRNSRWSTPVVSFSNIDDNESPTEAELLYMRILQCQIIECLKTTGTRVLFSNSRPPATGVVSGAR